MGNLSKIVILYRMLFKAMRLDEVTQGVKVGREEKWSRTEPKALQNSEVNKEESVNEVERELRTVLAWKPNEKSI